MIETLELFGNILLKVMDTDLIAFIWIPLFIGIFAFRFLYSMIGKRD